MVRISFLGLLLIGALLIQTTVLELVRFYVQPDLVLMLVVFFALINGVKPGIALGVVAGLLEDLMIGRFLGLNMLTMALIAGAAGILENKVYKENLLVPIIIVFFATIIRALLMILIGNIPGLSFSLVSSLKLGLMEAVWNAFLVPLVYRKFLFSNTHGWLRGFVNEVV